jgi:hypothetical protein
MGRLRWYSSRDERRCGVIVDGWKQNGGAETPKVPQLPRQEWGNPFHSVGHRI